LKSYIDILEIKVTIRFSLLFCILVCSNIYAADTVTSSTVSSTVSNTTAATVSSSSNTVGTTTVDRTVNSAHAPSININNSDVCTNAKSAAIQTQVLGIAGGGSIRDVNCENIKLSRELFRLGMKVAAVSLLCNNDFRVFDAMYMAGTPCPYEGLIGEEAKQAWLANPENIPEGSILLVSLNEKIYVNSSSDDYFSRNR
jgi:hypothetical protein